MQDYYKADRRKLQRILYNKPKQVVFGKHAEQELLFVFEHTSLEIWDKFQLYLRDYLLHNETRVVDGQVAKNYMFARWIDFLLKKNNPSFLEPTKNISFEFGIK